PFWSSRYSRSSDGSTSSATNTTTTRSACSVPVGAAAEENVRLVGSTYGHCATPQAPTTAATASAASSRVPLAAPRISRTTAATASTPTTTEVGFTQLLTGSPALPPAGTFPAAIPPATAPMQYGTSSEDKANTRPKLRRARGVTIALRKANPEPRSTMPNAT